MCTRFVYFGNLGNTFSARSGRKIIDGEYFPKTAKNNGMTSNKGRLFY